MTNYCWYYHDANAGVYHAIERHANGASRTYRAVFCLDPATGQGKSYTGQLPSRLTAEAIMYHLAPEAVLLPGLPAFLR